MKIFIAILGAILIFLIVKIINVLVWNSPFAIIIAIAIIAIILYWRDNQNNKPKHKQFKMR